MTCSKPVEKQRATRRAPDSGDVLKHAARELRQPPANVHAGDCHAPRLHVCRDRPAPALLAAPFRDHVQALREKYPEVQIELIADGRLMDIVDERFDVGIP